MPPLVSIIVPAYNQSHYLEAAVQSALAQTYADVEVIVVDDGSTDDTRAVAQRLTDSRVRYVYQENRGLPAARNTGIRHARGSLLSFLDSDDLFLPDKVRLLLAAMEADPSLGLVAGQAVVIDETLFDAEEKMERAVAVAKDDLASVRTGRATPNMFSRVVVEYYGAMTPLNQLSSITEIGRAHV